MTEADPSSPVPRPELRIPKMGDLVAAELRARILRGDILPGESLPSEAGLLAEFQVSRPTLREALRLLEAQRLITVRRGSHRGPVVSIPDTGVTAQSLAMLLQVRGATLADVYRFRMLYEPPAARLAAERATPDDVARLRGILEEETHQLGDVAAFTAVSWRFHTELINLSGNTVMSVVTESLQRISQRFAERVMLVAPDRPDQQARSVKAHAKLVTLIGVGDGAAAERFWGRHMEAAGRVLLPRAEKLSIVDLLD